MPLGRWGFGPERPSWARGALLGYLRKRPSHNQSCFPAKENTLGVGFRFRDPQQREGPGSPRLPNPQFPTSSGGQGAKTACVAFLSKGAVGLVLLGEERFLSLCRLQPPGSGLLPLGTWVVGAAPSSWTRGALQGPGRRRSSHAQSCFPKKENTLGVGFRLRRPPAKQQGSGSQGQPSPALPDCGGWVG